MALQCEPDPESRGRLALTQMGGPHPRGLEWDPRSGLSKGLPGTDAAVRATTPGEAQSPG